MQRIIIGITKYIDNVVFNRTTITDVLRVIKNEHIKQIMDKNRRYYGGDHMISSVPSGSIKTPQCPPVRPSLISSSRVRSS